MSELFLSGSVMKANLIEQEGTLWCGGVTVLRRQTKRDLLPAKLVCNWDGKE